MQESILSVVKKVKTNLGSSIWDDSFKAPIVLVFLRHFGCTFCRETVGSIASIEEKLKKKGYQVVFVHMSDPENADEFFSKYFNYPVHHISDPSKKLYQEFGVGSGNFWELFGVQTWVKGMYYAFAKGRGGPEESDGDIKQLGALFVIKDGAIVSSHYASNASDIMSIENFI